MNGFESHEEKDIVRKKKRNPLKHKSLLGDFITSKSLETEPKDAKYQKVFVTLKISSAFLKFSVFSFFAYFFYYIF